MASLRGYGVSRLPKYREHYPLATVDDSVHKDVPGAIATDFSEALRCLSVKAFRASVAMCRRARQSKL